MINKYPTFKRVKAMKKTKSAGFTNGKTIWINLFVPSFTSNLEVALDVAYIHEMIHCMDMSMTEDQVQYGTELYIDALIKSGL